jgi:hypothetical protein
MFRFLKIYREIVNKSKLFHKKYFINKNNKNQINLYVVVLKFNH